MDSDIHTKIKKRGYMYRQEFTELKGFSEWGRRRTLESVSQHEDTDIRERGSTDTQTSEGLQKDPVS